MFSSFGRGRQLLSSGYSSDRAGSRSILKTPREFEASAPRRLSFMGSSQGRGRSVHREMGDLDGPYDLDDHMCVQEEDHDDLNHCDRFDLDPPIVRGEEISNPIRSDPDEGLNSLVGVLKSLNKNFETQKHKVNPLPFKLDNLMVRREVN